MEITCIVCEIPFHCSESDLPFINNRECSLHKGLFAICTVCMTYFRLEGNKQVEPFDLAHCFGLVFDAIAEYKVRKLNLKV